MGQITKVLEGYPKKLEFYIVIKKEPEPWTTNKLCHALQTGFSRYTCWRRFHGHQPLSTMSPSPRYRGNPKGMSVFQSLNITCSKANRLVTQNDAVSLPHLGSRAVSNASPKLSHTNKHHDDSIGK